MYKYCLTSINYYSCYAVMRSVGELGSVFPDVDHIWRNVKNKTLINFILNKFIHLTGGKHRSKHTHSLEICVGLFYASIYLMNINYKKSLIDITNYQVGLLILTSFFTGWLSHLASDAMTVGGIYIFGKNVRLVPKKLFNLRFNTGGDWEKWVYNTTLKVNNIITAIVLLYPLILSERFQEFSRNAIRYIVGLS